MGSCLSFADGDDVDDGAEGRTMPMNGANLGDSSESAMVAACGAGISTMTWVL